MQPAQIPLNPFTNIINGSKKLLKTNFWAVIIVTALSMVAYVLMALVFTGLLLANVQDISDKTATLSDTLPQLIIGVFVFVAVIATVGLLVQLLTDRLILKGVRNQKASLPQEANFALSRFPLAFLAMLSIVGIMIGAAIGVTLLTLLLQAIGLEVIGVLIAVLGIIVSVIAFLPFLCLLPFVLLDEQKPTGVREAFNTAYALAKSVFGKVYLIILAMILVMMIVTAIFSGTTSTNTTSYNSSYTATTESRKSGGGSMISNVITGVLSIFFTAGFAELYSLARGGTGATSKTTPTAPTAGPSPSSSPK